jgi:hypothetical protein
MTKPDTVSLPGDPPTLAERTTYWFEVVAREEAARIGFDMAKEPNALFRMLATVMATDTLRHKAISLLKEHEEIDPDEARWHEQLREDRTNRYNALRGVGLR